MKKMILGLPLFDWALIIKVAKRKQDKNTSLWKN